MVAVEPNDQPDSGASDERKALKKASDEAGGTRVELFQEPGDQRSGSLEARRFLQTAINARQQRRPDTADASPPIGPLSGERIEDDSTRGSVAEDVARRAPAWARFEEIELTCHRHRGGRDLGRLLSPKGG